MASHLGLADSVLTLDHPDLDMPSPDVVAALLKELIERNPGKCQCYFSIVDGESNIRRFHTRRFHVEPSEEFVSGARAILGPQGVKFAS